jgi:hypothetical protein
MRRTGLYAFSPAWEKALLEWFYDAQDPVTGYWGPRLRSGKLLKGGDLLGTEKIFGLFADKGQARHPEFPLRYMDRLFVTTLAKISEPVPAGRDELHEWLLSVNRGTRLLVRHLWSHASVENKNKARQLFEKIVRDRFERYYIASEGAFRWNPEAEHADLDGTGEAISYLKSIGAFDGEAQKAAWGTSVIDLKDLGVQARSELRESDFMVVCNFPGVNSIRLYGNAPGLGDDLANVGLVHYPVKTCVLDMADLLPKVHQWLMTTSLNMGNWVTKEDLLNNDPLNRVLQSVPVSRGNIPLAIANELLRKHYRLVLMGFDVLQIPRCKMAFHLI